MHAPVTKADMIKELLIASLVGCLLLFALFFIERHEESKKTANANANATRR